MLSLVIACDQSLSDLPAPSELVPPALQATPTVSTVPTAPTLSPSVADAATPGEPSASPTPATTSETPAQFPRSDAEAGYWVSDLAVIAIERTPETPTVGETVRYSVTVENKGAMPALFADLDLVIDGEVVNSTFISELAAGETVTKQFDLRASAGERVVEAVVDASSQIDEQNEENNRLSLTVPGGAISDLEIDGVTWLPQNPSVGDQVIFSVVIANRGQGQSGSSRVTYSLLGSTLSFDQDRFGGILPGDSITENFTWTANTDEPVFRLTVDPEDEVVETDESNNAYNVIFEGILLADLVVEEIIWEPEKTSVGDTVTFTVTIRNIGNGNAGPSSIAYLETSDLLGASITIGAGAVGIIPPKESARETFQWTTKAEPTTLIVRLDSGEDVDETDETNNQRTIVYDGIILPDLMVEAITWEPETPNVGDTVAVTAVLTNQGEGSSSSANVNFYVSGGSLFGPTPLLMGFKEVAGLPSGATATTTFSWVATQGQPTFIVTVDEVGFVTETDESNNEAEVKFTGALLPDLVIESIEWNTSAPSEGDPVTFTVTVANHGEGSSSAGTVSYLIDDDPVFIDFSLFGSDVFDIIPPRESVTRTFIWTAKVGGADFKAIVDPGNDVDESSEVNNELTATHPGVAFPDLVIGSISWTPFDAVPGDSVSVRVLIKNLNDGSAAPSAVTYFVDGTGVGFDEIERLPGRSSVTHTFPWTVEVGQHTFKAIVDPVEVVQETMETNNEATAVGSW